MKTGKGAAVPWSLKTATLALALFAASPSPALADMTTVMVPMDDGVRLATDVYTPEDSGPWPVILERTPYNKDNEHDLGTFFNAGGYVFVAQDLRGRFASEGVDTVFFNDGDDGRATLEWIAAQGFCNGAIGTYGGSALGITQLLLAPGAADALRCQLIMVGTPDFYSHALFQGGSFRTYMVENWLAGQGSSYVLPDWEDHYILSDYWDPVRIVDDYGLVRVPALHMGGWFDIFTQGTLDSFSGYNDAGGTGARGEQHLVIGPWTHSMTINPQGDYTLSDDAVLSDEYFVYLVQTWFDHCLKGLANDADTWPATLTYRMGDFFDLSAPGHEWVEADAWPPDAPMVPFYLRGDGTLTEELPGDEGASSFTYRPWEPVPTLCGSNLFAAQHPGPCDQAPLAERSDVLVFMTPPLEEPLEVTGRVQARLLVSSDAPDTDFSVKLVDVRPDGRHELVTEGILRLRHRNGQDVEEFLSAGEVVEALVDLWSTSMVFNTGHSLGLHITSSNSPRFDPNPNTASAFRAGDEPREAGNTVHHSSARASALLLPIPGHPPVIEPEPETDAEPEGFPEGLTEEPGTEPAADAITDDGHDAPPPDGPDDPGSDENGEGCGCGMVR
jgi:predicted acyl esterase